jgi:transposase InsO family protein
MKYQFIEQYSEIFHIERMCRVLKVARSGYYAWRKRPLSPRKQEELRFKVQIREVYMQSKAIYGSPRITEELKSRAIPCGRNRVARLMKEMGLRSLVVKKHLKTSRPGTQNPRIPNRLSGISSLRTPNQVWVSDITYIWTQEGWAYLIAILDLYSRKIISWKLHHRLTQDSVIDCVQYAWTSRKPSPGLIFHSDHGSQYTSLSCQSLLKDRGILQSLTGPNHCYDNAVMESFFHTLKTEWTNSQSFNTRQQLKQSLFNYIEVFYNRNRRHSSIGYLAPEQFESFANYS